jgi:hypothetical protein
MTLEKNINSAFDMTDEELIEALGVASLGNVEFGDAITTRAGLISIKAGAPSIFSEPGFWDKLKIAGEAFFLKLWNEVKAIVCYVYRKDLKIEDDLDLIKYLVGLVVALGTISNPLAVLVITIAVKRGLDLLCPLPAPTK